MNEDLAKTSKALTDIRKAWRESSFLVVIEHSNSMLRLIKATSLVSVIEDLENPSKALTNTRSPKED